MTRTSLITGGAGFIGSHLAERLLGQGDHVVVVDDLSTGSLENLAHLNCSPRFELVIGDVSNRHTLEPLIERCDFVFHLAAAVGVRLVVSDPIRTIKTNIHTTEQVLDLATARCKPVLFTSTSEVYGKAPKVPFHEEDDLVFGSPRHARWAYACSKALDEFIALAYARDRNSKVTIVRLFNTIGPRQTDRYGMVLPAFVRQALSNRPITVFGDGTQTRCFCDVEDVTWALSRVASIAGSHMEVLNVGGQREMSICDLAHLVRSELGSSSEIVFIPYSEAYEEGFDDMQRRAPDIRKLQSLTGFSPRIPLRTSIHRIAKSQCNLDRVVMPEVSSLRRLGSGLPMPESS
jgi:UDP-glucose 4-epimerase